MIAAAVAVFAAVWPSAALALINSTTSSANPSAVGQSVAFTATMTGIIVTPTGTVVFKDNGIAISAALTLNGQGKATFTTNVLPAGSHSITAEYNGDLVYNASASSPLTQTVNAAASSTTLGTSVTPSAFTQNVTFTATVSGGSGQGTRTPHSPISRAIRPMPSAASAAASATAL